ncbi:MAG: UDP-N-acetylmuramate dehydrogenase [Bacteroidales bacterium]|nr:UDP-N-acetylmuramate dehydrogenase [Bacteroidales bacterium]
MNDILNYSLKSLNTFKIDVNADRFISFDNLYEFLIFAKENKNIFKQKFIVTGEGSNLLFTKDYNGTVIHPETKVFGVLNETDTHYIVQSEAGLKWDDFVENTLKLEAYGLENLSLIPGTVGASVVQNIGAYGVEVGDFVDKVKYICLEDFVIKTITGNDCQFSYRNSIFKNELKNKAIVVAVDFKLNKIPECNTNYADIKRCISDNVDITPMFIRKAVIDIRNKKLPDPDIIGNAGSFFKNPVIDKTKFDELLLKFPDLRYYDLHNGKYKIAAGWLIDVCGFKGFEHKGAAVHEKQALVLINKTGKAEGKDIKELADIILKKLKDKFGLSLEPEVIIL